MNARSKSPAAPASLRRRLREEARSAILDAAEQVLAAQGMKAARMEDIAARVGVSVGTLYNYFEDRRQLLEALLDKQARELCARLDTELERSQGGVYRERLRGFVRQLLEHAKAHLPLFTVLLERPAGVPPELSAQELLRLQEQKWELLSRLERLCEQGVHEGALRPEDVSHYPLLLLGMMRTLLVQRLHAHEPLDIEALGALVLRCFLEGAAPRPR